MLKERGHPTVQRGKLAAGYTSFPPTYVLWALLSSSILNHIQLQLNHSCVPSVRPSFSSGTSELHLIAARDISKGDKLTMAYVDVTRRAGETAIEARRRRRYELARGWRFACECPKCTNEELSTVEEENLSAFTQDSKLEPQVTHYLNADREESIDN